MLTGDKIHSVRLKISDNYLNDRHLRGQSGHYKKSCLDGGYIYNVGCIYIYIKLSDKCSRKRKLNLNRSLYSEDETIEVS